MADYIVSNIKNEVEIVPFDDGTQSDVYLICFQHRNWKISNFVYNIILEIDGTKNIEEILSSIQHRYSKNIDVTAIETVVNFLEYNRLLIDCDKDKSLPASRNKMLWGRITVIPSKVVEKFSFLSFLFNRYIVIPGCFIIILWLLFICINYSSVDVSQSVHSLEISDFIICYVHIFLIGMLHEFGHSVALLSNGEKPGRIGAGIYFIMPVLFSDVTKTWKLNRYRRLQVDFGGMYFQGLSLVILFCLNTLFVHYNLLDIAIVMSAFQIMNNFNPFIKLDGYWILCDYLGTIDVNKTMLQLIKCSFSSKKERIVQNFSITKIIVIYIYMLIFIVFTTYFILTVFNLGTMACKTFTGDILYVVHDFHIIYSWNFSVICRYISSRFSDFIVLLFGFRIAIGILKVIMSIIFKLIWRMKNEIN